jgi:hypothetical protein
VASDGVLNPSNSDGLRSNKLLGTYAKNWCEFLYPKPSVTVNEKELERGYGTLPERFDILLQR